MHPDRHCLQPAGWGRFFSVTASAIAKEAARVPKTLSEIKENFLLLSGEILSLREYKQTDAP